MPILTDEERIGTTLSGKYVLDSVIGRGGMGTVFAGHHALSSRGVAVKVLHPQHVRDPVAVRRFLNEARTAAAFRHANVVDVLDVDVLEDGTVFLVLELLEGETLGELLNRVGRLPVAETLSIVVPVLRALAHAHRINIVHRDLKPDNIFLTPGAKCAFPIILDFGIAKMLDAPEQSIETVTGTIIGTPQYMAPEQALGSSENTAQLDVYAMGVVLFECLAGVRPIDGINPATVLAKLVTGQVPTLISVAPDVSPGMSEITAKALSTAARDRFVTCDDFADALLAEASALGVAVPMPQPGDKLAGGEGARTQRLRAITDGSARRAIGKRRSEPPTPTLGEHELAEARASIANSTPYDGVSRPNSTQSTMAPTTAQRAVRTTPASLLGAALAFVVVGVAGVATMRREPEPQQSVRSPTLLASSASANTAARTNAPAVSGAVAAQSTAAPQATVDAGAPSTPTANARRPARQPSTNAPSANGSQLAATQAAAAPTVTAAPSTPAAQPSTPTRASGQQRPPEVTNVW